MFEFLKKFAYENRYENIYLNSIPETICYYDKLGFRMKHGTHDTGRYRSNIAKLKHSLSKAKLNGYDDITEDKIVKETLRYFDRFMEGYSMLGKKTEELRMDGYPMVYELSN